MNERYEPKPDRPNPNAFVAPEHYPVAKTMQRDRKTGELIIEQHEIFRYSAANPPRFKWLGHSRYR